MADFVAVIRRAVDGLATNTPEARVRVYEKARGAVQRQLENMKPRPPEEMLRRQFDKLELAFAEVESEQSPTTDPTTQSQVVLAIIPRQRPGLSFGLTSSGKVGIRTANYATEDDLLEIGGMREILQEAVDDLVRLTAGSNAFRAVEVIATRYRTALSDEHGLLSVDRLYAQGLRLENLSRQIRKEVTTSDFPDMAIEVAEALDSVIAIHGPTIMSTALGRDLFARASRYTSDAELEERYRDTTLNLWLETRHQGRVVEEDDLTEVIAINAEINAGAHPVQSTELARSTNANLLATLAKMVIYSGGGIVAAKALDDSILATDAASNLTAIIDHVWLFFYANHDAIKAVVAASGGELLWVDSLLRWIELRRAMKYADPNI